MPFESFEFSFFRFQTFVCNLIRLLNNCVIGRVLYGAIDCTAHSLFALLLFLFLLPNSVLFRGQKNERAAPLKWHVSSVGIHRPAFQYMCQVESSGAVLGRLNS